MNSPTADELKCREVMRVAFEKWYWAAGTCPADQKGDCFYYAENDQIAWLAWQAAYTAKDELLKEMAEALEAAKDAVPNSITLQIIEQALQKYNAMIKG